MHEVVSNRLQNDIKIVGNFNLPTVESCGNECGNEMGATGSYPPPLRHRLTRGFTLCLSPFAPETAASPGCRGGSGSRRMQVAHEAPTDA